VSTEYVEHREGFYRVAGTRVSLDSIVYAFLSGQSAESIAQSFPVLTLEQVYGAITFYLGHRSEVDDDLAARAQEEDSFREPQSLPEDLREKLNRARHQPQSR